MKDLRVDVQLMPPAATKFIRVQLLPPNDATGRLLPCNQGNCATNANVCGKKGSNLACDVVDLHNLFCFYLAPAKASKRETNNLRSFQREGN
ncbi:hypothetical protein Zmor_010677 [Zophobas morio]|uniref:Uncharacterized protein n=1 Tax=Zophobas morio TaxID=2755281 RepID=A0AA38ILB7_9CUCU|nr:hypothetical protein Zmor_010677 [Zophobas morio]